jgi:uncharacterized protein YciI
MKRIMLVLLVLSPFLVSAQQKTEKKPEPQEKKSESQVRQYFFVMLTAGNDRTQDSVTAAKIQEGHMANINRLYTEGKLKVAGPFGDEGTWIGLFIFDCASKEEVEKLLLTDPAVKSGRLAYEIHPWWTAPIGSFIPGTPKKS